MTPAQKAAMLVQMCAMSDQLAMTGIRMQHPASPTTWGYQPALRRLPPERQATASLLLTELSAMTFPVNPVAIAGEKPSAPPSGPDSDQLRLF